MSFEIVELQITFRAARVQSVLSGWSQFSISFYEIVYSNVTFHSRC